MQVSFETIKVSKNVVAYNFVATKNTWSHQRRKRREKQKIGELLHDSGIMDKETSLKETVDSPSEDLKTDTSVPEGTSEQRNQKHCTCPRATTPDVENALNKLAEVRMSSPGSCKREHEEDESEGYYQFKKLKTGAGECKCHHNEFFLKALLVIRKANSETSVELSWVEGIENREFLHQIMQYIKNNLKVNEQ